MDATENDLPPSVDFVVQGFPTLKFKPAGSRSFLDFNGDRSYESLIEFVEEKAVNDLSKLSQTPSTPAAEHQATFDVHHEEL